MTEKGGEGGEVNIKKICNKRQRLLETLCEWRPYFSLGI